MNDPGFMLALLALNVVYSSINIRKIKFIAYIYIRFSQNLDENSYISAITEAGKHLHGVFLLIAGQRRRPVRARGYKTFFMLNSIEHEIFPADKC